MVDIADEAGVSPGTVHYHFRTKQEILVRALLWANERLTRALEEATTSSDDPLVRIAMFLERTIPYPGVRQDEYLLEIELWNQIRQHPELLVPYERFAQQWLRQLTSLIHEGTSSGAFRISTTADEVALRLAALTDGLAALASVGSSSLDAARVRRLVLHFAAEQLDVNVDALTSHADRAISCW